MSLEAQPYLELIKSLVPLDSLSEEGFSQAVGQMKIIWIPRKEVIFEKGDDDEVSIYLLSGTIELDSGDRVKVVKGGTPECCYALAGLKPRHYTATTNTDVTIASIDTNNLSKILTWEQMANSTNASGYGVEELSEASEGTDWIIQTLRKPAFLKLPAANIQSLLVQFEELPVTDGQVIIREEEEGDYFYLIKHGTCRVSRHSRKDGREVIFDRMRDGDAFGEDALVSERPRNATITMTSDGVLKRLAKEHFIKLMKEPLLQWIDGNEAATLLDTGVVFLDVRLRSEYRNGSVSNSRNIPLYLLRLKVKELEKDKSYVVFCDTGDRSAAAAFLLTESGFDVRALKGGLGTLVDDVK